MRRGTQGRGAAAAAVLAALWCAAAPAAWAAATRSPPPGPPNAPAADLAAAVAPAVAAGATVSVAVLPAAGGQPVTGVNPDLRLAPGVAWGAVTAAVALWHLGPTFSVRTLVEAPAPRHGTVLGNLVLVGGGDPTLDDARLAALARNVAERVRTVTGGVLADAARFAYPLVPAGWPVGLLTAAQVPAPAALSVDGGAVTVTVTPGARPGAPAQVQEAPAPLVPLAGGVRTSPAGSGAAPSPTVAYDAAAGAIRLSGSVPVGAAPYTSAVFPPGAARLAAAAFARDLMADGVRLSGGVGAGAPVSGAVPLASVASPPLARWLSALWGSAGAAPSPLAAEDLFRLLCRPTDAAPCGTDADAAVVDAFLSAIGLGGGAVAADGSGLSQRDLASAHVLARALQVAGWHAWGQALVDSLPSLAPSLAGSPAGSTGVWGAAGDRLSLLARVPVAGGKVRIVALLAAGLPSPTAAAVLAERVLQAAAGGHPLPAPRLPAAAADLLPGGGGPVLKALDGAGPGAVAALTVWPVGARLPAWNLRGAALLPVTGATGALVAAAALSAAGPAHLTTRVVVDGTFAGSTLNGSIGLVGGFDPTLDAAGLASLAREVAGLGVRRVTAGVVVDDLALPPTVPPTWPWEEVGGTAAAGDALSAGGGLFSLAVLPGARPGSRAVVQVVPASTPVFVHDQARTVAGDGQSLAVWPDPISGHLVVTGTIGAGRRLEVVFLRTAPDPALAAGRLFLQDLRQAGVDVRGGVARAAVPDVAPTLAALPGPGFAALTDSLLADPTPAAAWDEAAILGGALRGVAGGQAVAAALARTQAFWARAGAGAPPPVLTDPVGVGGDDRMATYGCAEALATMAANTGVDSQLPLLLPLLPTGVAGQGVRAVVGTAPGQGWLAGYVIAGGRPSLALCASLSSLTRPAGPLLVRIAQAVAAWTPPRA
ncbi:MAG: D-alanyl-D-alanine carboxypeptidase/D-alanyl-D-alanine-endopeptidase [Firmicutes bacterium]|nr:D-alanyl-D-alanine carboxypeptidase/D-alanyl-D-alanine-endopeptidase [Bacillota bacterium]